MIGTNIIKKKIREGLISNYIHLLVEAHNFIISKNEIVENVNEDKRRNQLMHHMNLLKKNYRLKGPILAEVANQNANYTTTSFADLSFYPTQYSETTVIFECKIVKAYQYKSVTEKQLYKDGLDRFGAKYDSSFGFCGIIFFCENNTHFQVNEQILEHLSEDYLDFSRQFNKDYIFKYDYLKIPDLYVVLLSY